MSDPHTTCSYGWRNCTNCYEVCTEASPCTCCLLARDTSHRYWQEREKARCKSDMAYHCATHDTQWLDDESDRCEYKRMVDAEAAIQRVRKWHAEHCDECNDTGPCPTIRALDGSNSPPVTSEITGPLIDPDCRDGKHSSCVGGPCECPCHELAAP